MANIISVANIAKAMVKSSHEIGTLVFRLVNSKTMIMRVVKQQKHQQNMHQAHWDLASFGMPADAANAKQMHVRTTSTIRTMPVGRVSDLKSTCNMTKLFQESQSLFIVLDFQCFWSLETALHSSKHLCAVSQCHKCQQIQSNSFFSSRCPLVFLFHRDSLKIKSSLW